MVLFVVEHLEETLGEWLLIEYEHARRLLQPYRLLVTNVRKPSHRRKLEDEGFQVDRRRVFELFNPERLLVLDPKAGKLLQPEDFEGVEALVVGGILGDHPPRGRTWSLLTRFCIGARVRSLGKPQFTIDGALFMAKKVYEGVRLEEIPVVDQVTLKVSKAHEIEIPYGYPLVDGKPLISPKLVEYLLSGWSPEGF
ncbi:MAG: hypothetical protein DRO46_03395 [Candidatus Hecatellales archaeon]|nr:MAG: hypothetical protein DRO46_03395 [Candidatus Hecatellales archaeon]